MRPFRRTRTLCGDGAVELGNPCRVKDRGIDLDLLCAEPHIEDSQEICQYLLFLRACVNMKEQMITIAAVRNDGFAEAHGHQLFHRHACHPAGSFLFFSGSADAARPDRIRVNQQPLVAGDIAVCGRLVRTLYQPLMLFPRIARALHAVHRLVEGAVRIPGELFGYGRTVRSEIPADDRLGINAADFNDLIRLMQQAQSAQNDVHSSSSSTVSACCTKLRQVSFSSHFTMPGINRPFSSRQE